jgi:HTH-type transcriptional regulator/antitoxin HipB
MKTKKPDDLDHYIAQRKEKDAEFAAAYDSEQAEWELGQLLAKTRESAGLTQEALARKIGSTRSAICRYERHPANLTLSTLEKVARATGRRLVVKFA